MNGYIWEGMGLGMMENDGFAMNADDYEVLEKP